MKQLMWIVAVLGLVAAAQASPVYQVVILEPPGYHPTYATGIAGGQEVGYSSASQGGPNHALLWTGSAASYVDLNPAGASLSQAYATDGTYQVGETFPNGHAALWQGTTQSYISLHPTGYDISKALAVDGGQQVGVATPAGTQASHAMLWFGSAQSAVDLNPPGANVSVAFATDGVQQVGYYSAGTFDHAAIWTGSAATVIDLHPTGWDDSWASAESNGQQGGYVHIAGGGRAAALWSGSASSFIDLDPQQIGLSGDSEVMGMAGIYQAGYASDANDIEHAVVWTGSADSVVDLQQFLPPGYLSSAAFAVDSLGNVVGVASDSTGIHAVMWVLVPEPGAIGLFGLSMLWALTRRR